MEFIKGKVIDPLEDISAIEKIAGVLDYFATLRHSIPGSLSGGFCRGLLFPETEDLVFDSLDGMEKWFNSRLFAHNLKLTLQGCELVFCHLDICGRKIDLSASLIGHLRATIQGCSSFARSGLLRGKTAASIPSS